jgi:flagellar secretion chaperone FliS
MSGLTYSPPRAYRDSAVLTAPPERLVVMLYDGARRFLYQAAAAMREGQIETAHHKLRRAEDIIAHLRDTLDHEQGGEIASRLQAIYAFNLRHLMQARFDRDAGKIDFVGQLLGQLRESWAAIENR